MIQRLLLGGVILGIGVGLLGWIALGPGTGTDAAVVTAGTGPILHVTNVAAVDATHVKFDVVTEAGAVAADPQAGWNLELKWNPAFFTYSSAPLRQLPTAGSALCPGADAVTFETPDGSGVNMGCVTLSGTYTTLGTLATVQLTVVSPGCSLIHLNSYGAPDNGDTSTGSYTISDDFSTPQLVQSLVDGTVNNLGQTCALAPTPTNTPAATNTPTATRTSTPTNTATVTNTPTATSTSTPTATNTSVAPTATNTSAPTATNTSVPPTATNTSAPTATNTSVPPTATNTSAPTATNTSVPPTATNTSAPTATNTSVPTATNTAAPPTATSTPTVTNTPTATNTAVPTATNTPVTPTATNTSVPATATDTPVVLPTSTNTPGAAGSTTLTGGAAAGDTELFVASTAGFGIGDSIRINPGGSNQEDNTIAGFASIILQTPLQNDHSAGETVVRLSGPQPCMTFGRKVDLTIGILRAFGSHAGDRRYKAKYDVNGDGVINELDLIQVATAPTCRHGHGDDDHHATSTPVPATKTPVPHHDDDDDDDDHDHGHRRLGHRGTDD